MTQKKYNHVHKLRRDRYSTGRAFYYCVLDCNFKIDVKHSLGKHVLCNKCNNIFTMNEYSIRSAKPVCMNCVKRKSYISPDHETVPDITEMIGVDINANTLERRNELRRTTDRTNDSIKELESEMSAIGRRTIVKEYDPEDDESDL